MKKSSFKRQDDKAKRAKNKYQETPLFLILVDNATFLVHFSTMDCSLNQCGTSPVLQCQFIDSKEKSIEITTL